MIKRKLIWIPNYIVRCSNDIQNLKHSSTGWVWTILLPNMFSIQILPVQWGSEIRPFEIQKHLKSELLKVGFQMVQSSNVWALALRPNHLKTGPFEIQLLKKWRPLVRISNCWASIFQIPFKIQTTCNPASFWLSEIQTSLDFRSKFFCDRP